MLNTSTGDFRTTIVMYHYIRDMHLTPFPDIKGRTNDEFLGQLDYITRHYEMMPPKEFLRRLGDRERIPSNVCLLTFDDGFIDHYETVWPELTRRGLGGMFFVISEPYTHGRVPYVHKVHFLLASLGAKSLTDVVIEEAAQRALVWDLAELQNRFESKARYDDLDTAFIKHMLSEIIPQDARESILASAFRKEIGPEREFAESLYASENQLKELWLSGMVVGGHSATHPKLGMCGASEQRRQIGQSAALLTSLGVPAPWHFSYPYGHNNESTPPLLEAAGFVTAVTTRPVRIAQSYDDPMHLCRVDTNDLPTNGDAPVAPLTEQALARA